MARALQRNDSILRGASAAWDRLQPEPNPFTAQASLAALAASGSASAACGWQPLHGIRGDPAQPEVAVPLYAKSLSWAEYVFDQQSARAHERAVGPYDLRLQVTLPCTPVAGLRLLAGDAAARRKLIPALDHSLTSLALSSVHVTFSTRQEVEWFRAHGWVIRRGIQCHWPKRGYSSFADFLATLSSRRRKTIRRERRQVQLRGSGSAPFLQTSFSPRSLQPSIPTIGQRSTGVRVKPISHATFFADAAPNCGIRWC